MVSVHRCDATIDQANPFAVGGDILDLALGQAKLYGRIVKCGSEYPVTQKSPSLPLPKLTCNQGIGEYNGKEAEVLKVKWPCRREWCSRVRPTEILTGPTESFARHDHALAVSNPLAGREPDNNEWGG